MEGFQEPTPGGDSGQTDVHAGAASLLPAFLQATGSPRASHVSRPSPLPGVQGQQQGQPQLLQG